VAGDGTPPLDRSTASLSDPLPDTPAAAAMRDALAEPAVDPAARHGGHAHGDNPADARAGRATPADAASRGLAGSGGRTPSVDVTGAPATGVAAGTATGGTATQRSAAAPETGSLDVGGASAAAGDPPDRGTGQ
jgi:hypothetical protein